MVPFKLPILRYLACVPSLSYVQRLIYQTCFVLGTLALSVKPIKPQDRAGAPFISDERSYLTEPKD